MFTFILSLALGCASDTVAQPAVREHKAPSVPTTEQRAVASRIAEPSKKPPAAAQSTGPVSELPAKTSLGNAATVDIAAGSGIYNQYCVACHQADGTGMSGMLAGDFSDPERLAKSDAELLQTIRKGLAGKKGQMPPWESTLTEAQMMDVLAYIRKEYGK